MGVPTSEVGYTSATTGRGDHEVQKGHVVALGEKNIANKTNKNLHQMLGIPRVQQLLFPQECKVQQLLFPQECKVQQLLFPQECKVQQLLVPQECKVQQLIFPQECKVQQ